MKSLKIDYALVSLAKKIILLCLLILTISYAVFTVVLIPHLEDELDSKLKTYGITNFSYSGLSLESANSIYLDQLSFNLKLNSKTLILRGTGLRLLFTLDNLFFFQAKHLDLESLFLIDKNSKDIDLSSTSKEENDDTVLKELIFKNYAYLIPLTSLRIAHAKIKTNLDFLEQTEFIFESSELKKDFKELSLKTNLKIDDSDFAYFKIKQDAKNRIFNLSLEENKEEFLKLSTKKEEKFLIEFATKPRILSEKYRKVFSNYNNKLFNPFFPETLSGEIELFNEKYFANAKLKTDQLILEDYALKLLTPSCEIRIKNLSENKLYITQSSFGIFAGIINATASLTYSGNGEGVLSLNKLDLQKLMDYYPQEKIAASGIINGQVPLKLNSGTLTITNATIKALGSGTIKANVFADQSNLNPQLALLASTLKNYQYKSLSAESNLSKNGDLQIKLHLAGANPDFQSGREINLNIDISENIPALLESLKLTSKLEESLGNVKLGNKNK